MKFSMGERTLATVLVLPTALAVIVLAIVQYRWSEEVRTATSIRLADSLQMSMVSWQLNLFRDLSDVCRRMALESTTLSQPELDQTARRFFDEQARAGHAETVSDLLLVTADPLRSTLRWDSSAHGFVPIDSAAVDSVRRALTPGRDTGAPSMQSDAVAGDWRFDPALPGLVQMVSILPTGPHASGRRATAADLVIRLDLEHVRARVLPELANRYFSGIDGLDYQVALVAGSSPRRVIYSSDASFGEDDPLDADGRMNVFGRSVDAATPSSLLVFHPRAHASLASPSTGAVWFPLLANSPTQDDWRLVVRHRRGGALGAFVEEIHRRDLTISLGLLLLLIISMTMWTIISQRAQRLAQVQLNFVTAVSHDLRTPLTIIASAADNIARGVVHERDQMAQYGTVIGNQAKRLSALVEQVLLFASTRESTHRVVLRPIDVAEVIDTTLAASAELIQTSRVTVERQVEPDLPPVMGDAFWLSQCLQNLVTNALKYGGGQPWLGIRASLVTLGTGREIQVCVMDRGIGIAPPELRQIFKPFYRSPSVVTTRIQGTGLGLAVAKNVAEAMNGHLTVTSEPGQGSTFTLHLPCEAAPSRVTSSA